jgi:hypothetical protein
VELLAAAAAAAAAVAAAATAATEEAGGGEGAETKDSEVGNREFLDSLSGILRAAGYFFCSVEEAAGAGDPGLAAVVAWR